MHRSPRGVTTRQLLFAFAGVAVVALLIASTQTCLRVGFRTGLWLDECPDGELRQTISVSAPELKRGAFGGVTVSATATYLVAPNDARHSEAITNFTPSLSLVTATGETALPPKKSWESTGRARFAAVELPKVNDGEYTLRVRVTSPIGDSSLDLPLPLFTPARVHVLTDRPLYEPGNTVKFRALALRASDLSPLEERPGTWRVTDPEGTLLLEERASSGPWGVVTGSFPLDRGAQSGTWTVTWTSGAQSESRSFTVKPFTLPRFRVEASTEKPFYRRGERPRLKGKVAYSSGAPVANAKVELTWNVSGDWPPPTAWIEGKALPKSATAGKDGAFTVELPAVPQDLQGQATLSAALGAVDASGDRVESGASVLLSQDLIAVTAVTELADGLVQGFNNRLFLRATTADGRVLDDVALNVKRLWEPGDKGTDAPADEDGVASLQVDPGPPVNVIIPAQPFRPPAKVKAVQRTNLSERLGYNEDEDVSLADRMAFDRLDAKLEGCARYVDSPGTGVPVALAVAASGTVKAAATPATLAGECVKRALAGFTLGAGKERFFDVAWSFSDEELPAFEFELDGYPDVPEELHQRLAEAFLEARDCLPASVRSGELPRLLRWRLGKAAKSVEISWVPVTGDAFAEGALGCVTSRVRDVALPHRARPEDEEVPGQDAIGFATVRVNAPEKYEAIKPKDTVMEGYEFLVTAKRGGETLGSTRLRMTPGAVPQIRLRASTQLVKPGELVTVEILRGPDFTGELPEKLFLSRAFESVEAKVDQEKRTASFTIPPAWQGWAGVQWGGGQVFFFVQSPSTLAVKVTPEQPRYAPGQVAQLGIETTIGGAGGPAGVGLFGVDDSLAQLAPLPGADELASVRLQATGAAAFGSMDAQALSLGRVRGKNAAAATLLRVSALPPPPEVEAAVAATGATAFDPNETQVDRFYVVLGELYTQVRAWENSAPAAEKMTPRVMARLWSQALDAVEGRKESAKDAWGRRLRLHRLPADLLALTEPRAVVVAGTRLPEDLQNWSQWVAKEKP